MPIVNSIIKAQINDLIEQTKILEQSQSQEVFSQGLANIIESSLKSCIVTIQAGIPVTTVGSPTTQTGVTTAPGTGTLS